MGIPVAEQETVVHISRDSNVATIWTSDSTMITKLDKRVETSGEWSCREEHGQDGTLVDKIYTVPKSFISFRKKKREISEEQRQAASERFKSMWKDRGAESSEAH